MALRRFGAVAMKPASEKQTAWIKARFHEQIAKGEVDASQIDRLTMSEASGVIRRNIQEKRPLLQHFAVSRKGLSWVFTAETRQNALNHASHDAKTAYNYGYWSEGGKVDGELLGPFLNKRLCIEYLEGRGDLAVRYQNAQIKREIEGA
nr:MAG TPA: hypothetical protein [Caudoviricetes sp.]